MTPEELVATREGANVDYAPEITYDDWQAMARALLTHIDSQAAQIAALTEKLVESEARRMYPFTVPMWDNLPDEDFTKRTFGGMEDRHGKAFFRLKARQQLKAEMPEVEWDG